MTPNVTFHNITDVDHADSVQLSESGIPHLTGRVTRPDLPDLVGGQLGVSMPLATSNLLQFAEPNKIEFDMEGATLSPPVSHVVAVGSGKQVIRSHAARIVPTGTVVADVESVRDLSIGKAISDAMGVDFPLGASDPHLAMVQRSSSSGRPQPAFASAVNLGPETRDVFWGKIVVHRDLHCPVATAGTFIPSPATSVNYTRCVTKEVA